MPAKLSARLVRDTVLLLLALTLGLIVLQNRMRNATSQTDDDDRTGTESEEEAADRRISKLGGLTPGSENAPPIQAPPRFDPNREGPIEQPIPDEVIDPLEELELIEEGDVPAAPPPSLTVDPRALASTEIFHEALATYIDAAIDGQDPNAPDQGFAALVDTITSAIAEEGLQIPEGGVALVNMDGSLQGELNQSGDWLLYSSVEPAPTALPPIPAELRQQSGAADQEIASENGEQFLVTTVYTYVPSINVHLVSSIISTP